MANNARRDTGNNKANDSSVENATSGGAADTPSLVRGAGATPEGSGSIANARAGGNYAHELDVTGEFPQPVLSDGTSGEATAKAEEAEDSETKPAPADSPSAHERTSFLLQHLESEIQRLQGKFESVAAELRVREAKISALRSQGEAKDALLNDLRRQIDAQDTAHSALRTELEQANSRIADLIAAEEAGEINLAQAEADLQEARQFVAGAEGNRKELLEKIARLSDATDRDAKAAAGAQRLYEDEVKRTSGLRARIEELEADIEDSKKRWSVLNDELADYRSKLDASEGRLAEALASSTAEARVREELADEAADLESRVEELEAQVAAGEVAHRELTSRLEEERAAAARLREDVASAAARGDQAVAELNARDKRIAELERIAVEASAERERERSSAQQKIARLDGLLSASARQIDELARAIDAREDTISQLEARLHARNDDDAVLERSVRRLAEIDAGIADLERSLVPTADENTRPASEGEAPAVSPDSGGAVNSSRKMVDAVVGDKPPYPARKVQVVAQSDSSDIQIPPRVNRPR